MTLDLASPTEEEIVGGRNWSIVAVVVEQTVSNPWVVETESDCSSGEAGFDGIVIEGGEKKVTLAQLVVPKLKASKLGIRKPNLLRQAVNRCSPLI